MTLRIAAQLAVAALVAIPVGAGGRDGEPVSCRLESTATTVTTDQAITVRPLIRNDSSGPIVLVAGQDGSSGWLSDNQPLPWTRFTIDGDPPYHGPGCGTLNGLRASAFVTLAPGASFDPTDRAQGADIMGPLITRLEEPGRHVIAFRYSTLERGQAYWRAPEDLRTRVAEVARVDVRCSITIEVLPGDPTTPDPSKIRLPPPPLPR